MSGLVLCLVLTSVVGAYDGSENNVVWDSPSRDSSGSMPLGNGDIGLNVWAEEGGDLLFYVSKTDAWSENARLLKLGRIRVSFEPNPFGRGQLFRQTLSLSDASIVIMAGEGEKTLNVRVWVDANNPMIHVDASSATPFGMTASLEIWRTSERALADEERNSAYGLADSPEPVISHPDTVLSGQQDRVVWFHRNPVSIWGQTLDLQGMGEWGKRAKDPLLNRTFGGLVRGPDMQSEGDTVLKSKSPGLEHHIVIGVHTSQTETPKEWTRQMEAICADADGQAGAAAFAAHAEWWRDFWGRSWIQVSGAPEAEVVSRGYALQRFISACAGRGGYPIKFNGSIFTVDSREKGKVFDADYRSWGGPYWFQNTRLVYWPMLAAGDFEMMTPLFTMFINALPFAEARTREYFNHDGAFFPETMYFWGAYANDNYGWNREGKSPAHVDNTYIRYYYSGGLELIALMIDRFRYTSDDEFAREFLLPFADAIFAFYDTHYERDTNGKILFEPAQSLETWQQVVNPLPEIAGLQYVLDGLLTLPTEMGGKERREKWSRLKASLPPIPTREVGGKVVLSPAERILADSANCENPELYAIFPYRLYGLQRPDVDIAIRTFEARKFKGHSGWQQDDTQAALLGLTEQAKSYVAERLSRKHEGSRFPAFWGPNFDWIPDQDHGGNGLMALQCMLMQPVGDKILLFPAWPKEWDVDFRLHAPGNTVVEGRYCSGALETLTVSPESRRQGVVMSAREIE